MKSGLDRRLKDVEDAVSCVGSNGFNAAWQEHLETGTWPEHPTLRRFVADMRMFFIGATIQTSPKSTFEETLEHVCEPECKIWDFTEEELEYARSLWNSSPENEA